MTKAEFSRQIADFNEAIYDTENAIADIESRLRWDDESRKEWYMERLEKEKAELKDLQTRLEMFTNEYGAVFWNR